MLQQQWWVLSNDQQYGPFSDEQLRQLADAGRLRPDMQVISTGMQTPVAARFVSGLFGQLPETQATIVIEQRKPPIVATRPNRHAVINPTRFAAYLVVVLAVSASAFIVWHSRSSKQAKIAAADARALQAVTNAKALLSGDSVRDVATIEQALVKAHQDQFTTDKIGTKSLLNQVRQRRGELEAARQAERVFGQAKEQIDAKQVPEAIVLLRKYVQGPHAAQRDAAVHLLEEAEIAISDTLTLSGLSVMSDEQFAAAQLSLEIPDGKVAHPVLRLVRSETIAWNLVAERTRRNDLKVAAEKRLEAERLAVRREADEAKRLQAELAQAEKLAADQAAARAAAMQQAAQEEAINAMIEEHNDLVNAKVLRWGSNLQRSDRVKFIEPMSTVVRLSKAMSQYTKAEIIETFQVILERPDLPVMEEFIERSGFGELIVKVKADGKTRTLNDAWTYGVSLVIKEGAKGK